MMNMDQAKAQIEALIAEHGSVSKEMIALLAIDVAFDRAFDEIFGDQPNAFLTGGGLKPRKVGIVGHTGPVCVMIC